MDWDDFGWDMAALLRIMVSSTDPMTRRTAISLRETLSNYWYAFQQELFPRLETDLGCLSERYEFFVTVVEFVRLEVLLPSISGLPGRPPEDRAALARAFIAKAAFDIPTTRALIERLQVDRTLYRLCGWSGVFRLPSEATFSRGFTSLEPTARCQAACTRR